MHVCLCFVDWIAGCCVQYTLTVYISRLNLFGISVKLKERVTCHFALLADEVVLFLFLGDLLNSCRVFPLF